MVTFTIEFDKPDKKYRGGDVVRCELYIRVTERFKAKSLTFQFEGVAHTEWTKPGQAKKVDGKTVMTQDKYVGHEEYFKHVEYLLGSESDSPGEFIEVGYYHYRISYKLPNDDLPSNIENRNGYVRYTVIAKFESINSPIKSHTAPFFIVSELDFNKLPDLYVPFCDTSESFYGLCCCRPKLLEISHELPRIGYVPGETIPVTIEINNHSAIRVDFIKVELLKNLIFKTTEPEIDKRTETKLLNEHSFRAKVPSNQSKKLKTEFFLDPSYNWKVFNKCEIITCEYFIRSEVEMSGCHKNPNIITKIVIGTISYDELPGRSDSNSNIIIASDDVIHENRRPSLTLIQSLEDFNRVPPLVSVREESELPSPSILGVPLAEEETFNFKI
uniref:CSON004662 protein n=1 Tax=Culicoides sonorensis TaxID=179676 RepID=A0A336M5Z5_CULSO